MVSDARVLGTRLTVPAVARPDYPGDMAAKRRELICRSGHRTVRTPVSIPLTLLFSREFRDLFEFPWVPVRA